MRQHRTGRKSNNAKPFYPIPETKGGFYPACCMAFNSFGGDMLEIDRALDALHFIDAGCSRDDWVKIGMAAKAAGLSFEDFNNWSSSGGNYGSEQECRTVWKSFKESGSITAATLFGIAHAQGWQDPSKTYTKTTSKKPVDVWKHCITATPAEPYIKRKQGKPDGLRVYPVNAPPLVIRGQNVAGWLVLPCWSGEQVQTLQFVSAKGDKLNLPGASFGDGFFTVGKITNRVYICEGIGQAWAVNQVTGTAAVVCFGAGRMMTVAKVLKAKHTAADLVLVPDKGKEKQAADIAAAVAGQWIELPHDKPQNYDVNDYLQDAGIIALTDLLERLKAPPMRFNLLSDADLEALPPIEWRIKKVLPKTGLVAVFGASGSGKTFVVLDMLRALAIGKNWFGYRTKHCNVLYCALEGEGGIAGRVAAYREKHGTTAANIRYLVEPFSLLEDKDLIALAKAIKANGQSADVVVLDTLNRAAPGADENDSKDMGQIIAAANQLQGLIGGLVVLVHHTGKDATKGLRGHSSLHAAVDAAIEVRRDGDRREWLIAKSKDGEDGALHPFKLDVVELGTDEDGEAVTSCVVHPLEEVANSFKKAMPPKSGNQRAVWDALEEIFRNADTVRPEPAPDSLPQGKPCISIESAIEKTRTRLVCEPKRQTERAQAAISGLVNRGLLCFDSGFLWCK